MHGIVRIVIEWKANHYQFDVEIGYLHRAFEKMRAIRIPQLFLIPTVSIMFRRLINNVGYA